MKRITQTTRVCRASQELCSNVARLKTLELTCSKSSGFTNKHGPAIHIDKLTAVIADDQANNVIRLFTFEGNFGTIFPVWGILSKEICKTFGFSFL